MELLVVLTIAAILSHLLWQKIISDMKEPGTNYNQQALDDEVAIIGGVMVLTLGGWIVVSLLQISSLLCNHDSLLDWSGIGIKIWAGTLLFLVGEPIRLCLSPYWLGREHMSGNRKVREMLS